MQQQQPQTKPIRILERSALSDCLFARNCHEDGLFNDLEWAAYNEWWKFYVRAVPGSPNGILYLSTTPETCYTRMSRRNRSEEKNVPIDYLNKLHQRHEEWMKPNSQVDETHNVAFVRVDADTEFEDNLERQMQMIDSVIQLVNRVIDQQERSTEESTN